MVGLLQARVETIYTCSVPGQAGVDAQGLEVVQPHLRSTKTMSDIYTSHVEPHAGLTYLAESFDSSFSAASLIGVRLQCKPLVNSVDLLDVGDLTDTQDSVAVNSQVNGRHSCSQMNSRLNQMVSRMKGNEMKVRKKELQVREQTWASTLGPTPTRLALIKQLETAEVIQQDRSAKDRKPRTEQ